MPNNIGAFGENFPYTNQHNLNMDWIIKIAKDFLDQYTQIQETITNGLQDLDDKATELTNLLDEWYNTHSSDIANQLANALLELNNWYTTHENYLNATLASNLATFNQLANAKTAESIASIPADYTQLSTDVSNTMENVDDIFLKLKNIQEGDYVPFTLRDEYIFQERAFMKADGTIESNVNEHDIIRLLDNTIKEISLPVMNTSALANIPTVIFKNGNTVVASYNASTTTSTKINCPVSYTDIYLNWWYCNTITPAYTSIDVVYTFKNLEDIISTCEVSEYGSEELVNKGYLAGNSIISDSNWVVSDYININRTYGDLWLYHRLFGLHSSQTTVTNVVFFDDDDNVINYTVINTADVPTEFITIIKVPSLATKMKFCTRATRIDSAKVYLFKNPQNVITDTENLFTNNYIKDLVPYFNGQNGYLDSNGYFHAVANAGWMATDYIDCNGFDEIKYGLLSGSNASVIAIYDKNQYPIKTLVPSTDEKIFSEGVLNITGASYIRICQFYLYEHITRTYGRIYKTAKNSFTQEYQHCVNKPFTFHNKLAYFCGDSITKGYTDVTTIITNSFPKVFSDSVGMNFENYANGGATITHVNGYNNILEDQIMPLITAQTINDADFLFINGGVNDWQLGVSLSNFRTAMGNLCNYIRANYSKEVFIILPIKEAGWKPINTPVATLEEYREIMGEVATKYEYNIINGNLFNFPDRNEPTAQIEQMYGDRLHPTEKGYRHIAKMLKTVLC